MYYLLDPRTTHSLYDSGVNSFRLLFENDIINKSNIANHADYHNINYVLYIY